MSFKVYFDLSSGLSKPIRVPKGTLKAIMRHVEKVEKTLGLETEQYENNPPHWKRTQYKNITDETLCKIAEEHNAWVRDLYQKLCERPSNPPKPREKITPLDAKQFWRATSFIHVDPSRWTAEYYRARMEAVYEVLRGREAEGVSTDTKALTTKQAAAVIRIFEQWLDPADLRLDVPNGYDHLASSGDGGYTWCEKCGAVDPDDAYACQKRGCPIRAEQEEEQQ